MIDLQLFIRVKKKEGIGFSINFVR